MAAVKREMLREILPALACMVVVLASFSMTRAVGGTPETSAMLLESMRASAIDLIPGSHQNVDVLQQAKTFAAAAAPQARTPAAKSPWSNGLSRPILFEPNVGQVPGEVTFVARLSEASVYLTRSAMVLRLHDAASPAGATVVRFQFEGASSEVRIEAAEPTTAKTHYLLGRSRNEWMTDIPTFRKIVYKGLYPGIDLCLYGKAGRLEYDFVVAPGADPSSIAVKVEGSESAVVDEQGNHVIVAKQTTVLRQMKPLAYQQSGSDRELVASGFEQMTENRFGFQLGAYDGTQTLVIDPVLDFSTYIGGARFDRARDVAVDSQGNVYVTGQTQSTDFPLENPLYDEPGGSFDMFVMKFDSSGSNLVYSTYIAGEGLDIAYGIAVDPVGNAYITGETQSDDFPTTRVLGGASTGNRACVLKLNPLGSDLVYATHFGGSNLEKGYDIVVDAIGNAYVTGLTASTDFPVKNPVQAQHGGGSFDAFVAKFDAAGGSVFATYLGGSDEDNLGASASGGIAIAIDDAGNIYVTGDTESIDFPTVNALFPELSGEQDAFVAKLGPAGRPLLFATYLGGNDEGTVFGEEAFGIDVDRVGNVYVAGYTQSTDFPVHNPIQAMLSGGSGDRDAFLSVFNPEGSGFIYSTFLGGSISEGPVAGGLTVDSCGNAFLAGMTNSSDFALENLADTPISGLRVFLASIAAGGSELTYAVSVGNASSVAVALGRGNAAYLTGHTGSRDFPAVNAFQAERAGIDADAFLARVSHVKPVGDAPGQYFVCSDEALRIKVKRNLSADRGREWFAFLLVQDQVTSPIYFLTNNGLEPFTPSQSINSVTPLTFGSETVVPDITLRQLGLKSGDQVIYAYLYERGGTLNLNHIVTVIAR